MAQVVKNKDTGENVITVEQWLATVNNPAYTEAWSKRADGPTPIFDQMWNSYLQAVNGNMVDDVQ
jgi:hypothetical protein